jgi:hypothetical protein
MKQDSARKILQRSLRGIQKYTRGYYTWSSSDGGKTGICVIMMCKCNARCPVSYRHAKLLSSSQVLVVIEYLAIIVGATVMRHYHQFLLPPIIYHFRRSLLSSYYEAFWKHFKVRD